MAGKSFESMLSRAILCTAERADAREREKVAQSRRNCFGKALGAALAGRQRAGPARRGALTTTETTNHLSGSHENR